MARLSSSQTRKLFMTAPHLATQGLESAKLELLDGSFTSSEFQRDFAHGFLVHEAAENYQALVRRQAVHQLVKQSVALGFGLHGDLGLEIGIGILQGLRAAVLRRPAPAVGQRIGGDAEQPRRERRATPLK